MARGKQTSIPGTDRSPEDPELEERLEDLRVIRAERIAIQQTEKAKLEAVLAYRRTMATPVDVYRYPDSDGTIRVAKFKATIKVSVRSDKADDDDDGDTDGDEDEGGVGIQ